MKPFGSVPNDFQGGFIGGIYGIESLGLLCRVAAIVVARLPPQMRRFRVAAPTPKVAAGKKTAFVERAAATLGLRNCQVITGRSCELAHQGTCKHRFDVVTARAVAPARTIWKDARDFTNRRGRFILYKTPEQAATDLPEVAEASRRNGITWSLTPVFELPENCGSRLFLYSQRAPLE